MAGKKRALGPSKKQNRPAKRTKPSSKSSFSGETSLSGGGGGARRRGGRGADEQQDKKRKGKRPEFIPAVEQDSDDDDDDVGSDAGERLDMDVDAEGDAEFLLKLDKKGMARSRLSLKEAHRKDKPSALARKSTLPKLGPSEPSPSSRKRRNEDGELESDGELISDLDEDDFAFGSGGSDDDDDLSIMSDSSAGGGGVDDNGGDGSMSEDDEDSMLDASDLGSDFDLSDESDEDAPSLATSSTLSDSAVRKGKRAASKDDDDLEQAYFDRKLAAREQPKRSKKEVKAPKRLPVIQEGEVVKDGSDDDDDEDDLLMSEDDDDDEPEFRAPEYKSDPLGQRFGRPSVRQLFDIDNKRERVLKARHEIAELGREASSRGEEGGINILHRLLALTSPRMAATKGLPLGLKERGAPIDKEIRIMAMVSLLAVFLDVIPGYRIRPLSEGERETRVSQQVQRQREWEQGLVHVYRKFLEICEAEVKAGAKSGSGLEPAAVHCLCQLAREKAEFNFGVNVLSVLVRRLGRKGWDEQHEACLEAVTHVVRTDVSSSSANSLHVVRLIARLVRARSFCVRPQVVGVLLNLRLRDELSGVRASTDTVYRQGGGNKQQQQQHHKGGKAKAAMSKQGSKKARKAAKEQAEIAKEMARAEGEVDVEERERTMTETLKLVFGLYFRIVKLERPGALLGAALEGLARFAHLVNVDFFRDLLDVLRRLVKVQQASLGGAVGQDDDDEEDDGLEEEGGGEWRNATRERLLCIVTAFELLQGQGESLNLDLGDFVRALYALVPLVSLSETVQEAPRLNSVRHHRSKAERKLLDTESDLLFRALASALLASRNSNLSSGAPVGRTLAFAKRLLSASLHWPSASQLRALALVKSLALREPRLEAMLETRDRQLDGVFEPRADDPDACGAQSTSWFELDLLAKVADEQVRDEATKLANYVRD